MTAIAAISFTGLFIWAVVLFVLGLVMALAPHDSALTRLAGFVLCVLVAGGFFLLLWLASVAAQTD